jgi:hypothetical protein
LFRSKTSSRRAPPKTRLPPAATRDCCARCPRSLPTAPTGFSATCGPTAFWGAPAVICAGHTARSATAPEQPRSSRRCSAPLPLTHCSCARAGARQLPGRWQGYSGVNIGMDGWSLPACVGRYGRPRRRDAALGWPQCNCWLSDCHAVWLSPPPWRPGTAQQLSASECYPTTFPPSFSLSCLHAETRGALLPLQLRRSSCHCPLLRATASHPLLLCACRRETAARPVAGLLGRQRRRGWLVAASLCGPLRPALKA